MKITHKITMDLQKPKTTPEVSVVQSDTYSRDLEISLLDDGKAFQVPEGVSAIVQYQKTDMKGGKYDTLPDGKRAWSVKGNVLTIALAPQVLTTPGMVLLSVSLLVRDHQISTFLIRLDVHPIAMGEMPKSEVYLNVTGLVTLPDSAEIGQLLQVSSLSKSGTIIGLKAVDVDELGIGVDNAQIQAAVEEYFADNPVLAEESDPTVPSWAKSPKKPSYTSAEVGADPLGAAGSAVNVHSSDVNAHADIREQVDALSNEKVDASYVDEKIAYAIAGKTHVEVNFANSVEDCIDTDKVYVMPDNMIWAYLKQNGTSYTNMIPYAADENGAVYNSTGYKAGFRLGSSGSESQYDAYPMVLSGYIPCKQGDVIRMKNITLQQGTQSSANQRISVYDAAFAHLGQANVDVLLDPVVTDTGIITEFKIQDNAYSFTTANTAYMRFCATYIGEDSVLTVNEVIAESEGSEGWASTGHSFISADNTERIAELEAELQDHAEETAALSERVTVLESDSESGVPAYVVSSAKAAARNVNNRYSGDSFSFAFISDAHCGWYLDTGHKAAAQAGQALNIINNRVPLDCVVHAGDFTTGAYDSTIVSTFQDIEDYTELMKLERSTVEIWMPGNHDDAPYQASADRLSQEQVFALIGRKNLIHDAVCDMGCNYGYRDFKAQKIRVIYLDTDDHRAWETTKTENPNTPTYLSAHTVGAAQIRWLVNEGLDFSGKDDAAKWGIIVVSHVPLNVTGAYANSTTGTAQKYSTDNASFVLGAYRLGTSGTVTIDGEEIPFDFTTQITRAFVWCFVHGHNHAYIDAQLYGIRSIGCPNAMNGREKASSDGITYSKTEGTADGTAFCIITIDKKNGKIYADHYGAGFDRSWDVDMTT